MNNDNKYFSLIKQIKRRRFWTVVISLLALLAVIELCSPGSIIIMDKVILDKKGINPAFSVIFSVAILICEFIVYKRVSSPINNSLLNECDPEKFLALDSAINKRQAKDDYYSLAYFCLGDFNRSLEYAEKMLASKNDLIKLLGLFNKTRCKYFSGEYDSLKEDVQLFSSISAKTKMNSQLKTIHDVQLKSMKLLVALSENDIDSIKEYSQIEPWTQSNMSKGYVSYLKGIAYERMGNKDDALLCFNQAKELCAKTIFAAS